MTVLFLAAGEGTRFHPYTQILAKPALPFCGAPLLFYSFYLVRELSPARVVINTYHRPEDIHTIGLELRHQGISVDFSDETVLLGSAGGIARARNKLQGQGGFLVCNADEVIVPASATVMRDFVNKAQRDDKLAMLMVMKHPEAGKKFGAVWVNSQRQVVGFGKIRPETSEELTPYHFIGPMYFKDRIFTRLEEKPSNILHDALKAAIAEGEAVGIFPIECQWFETGNLIDFLQATKNIVSLLMEGNKFLSHFIEVMAPGMELILAEGAQVLKHRTAVLDPKARVHGFLVLGANCHIGAGVSLTNCVCAEGVNLQQTETFANELLLRSPISG